jgi:hypothetical protein
VATEVAVLGFASPSDFAASMRSKFASWFVVLRIVGCTATNFRKDA